MFLEETRKRNRLRNRIRLRVLIKVKIRVKQPPATSYLRLTPFYKFLKKCYKGQNLENSLVMAVLRLALTRRLAPLHVNTPSVFQQIALP